MGGYFDREAPGSEHPAAPSPSRPGAYVPGEPDGTRRPTSASLDVAHAGGQLVASWADASREARAMLGQSRVDDEWDASLMARFSYVQGRTITGAEQLPGEPLGRGGRKGRTEYARAVMQSVEPRPRQDVRSRFDMLDDRADQVAVGNAAAYLQETLGELPPQVGAEGYARWIAQQRLAHENAGLAGDDAASRATLGADLTTSFAQQLEAQVDQIGAERQHAADRQEFAQALIAAYGREEAEAIAERWASMDQPERREDFAEVERELHEAGFRYSSDPDYDPAYGQGDGGGQDDDGDPRRGGRLARAAVRDAAR